jgi:two-component system cell cycle response regulator DivK
MSVSHYTTGVRPTILIVDDYVDALEAWALLLQAEGFNVLKASTGDDALSCATEAGPDLVVLDLELPGLSGVQVAQALRAADGTRHIPLIATTGHSHVDDLVAQAGFDALLTKPCDPPSLVAEIRRLISLGHRTAVPEH